MLKKLCTTYIVSIFILFITHILLSQDCPRVYREGQFLKTDFASGYQWYKNQQPIPEKNKSFIEPQDAGYYNVLVTGKSSLNFNHEIIPFKPIAFQPDPKELFLPGAPLHFQILFQSGDPVIAPDGKTAAAKEKLDFLSYLPIDSSAEHGILWVNHETTQANSSLGDGGGASVLEIIKENNKWKKNTTPKAIDFKSVGGTWNNCLGSQTHWGTILTSEEYEPQSNMELWKAGFKDTNTYNGYAKYLNYGWMVEVNPFVNPPTVEKRWGMGRFSHEGALCMPDRQTVFLMDDYAPGIFFKFYAQKPGDYSKGQLYAFKIEDGKGSWIALPMERDSLNDIRRIALKKGATIFIRLEDIELGAIGKIYLTETGKDQVDLSQAIKLGGKVAPHLEKFHKGSNIYSDYYGRILEYDPLTEKIRVLLEGGGGLKTDNHLANPDNIAMDLKRNLLFIMEDLNDFTQNRIPAIQQTKEVTNEIYVLDLRIQSPSVDDLKRLAVIPLGAEPTGGCFNNHYDTFFFNIQHPLPTNNPPYNKDTTVAIQFK